MTKIIIKYVCLFISLLILLGGCSCTNDSYQETIRKIDDIELHFFCLTEWNSCHAYGVEAFRKIGWRKKERVDVFELVPELAPFQTSASGKVAFVAIEIYGITPEILLDEWAESFFFDRTKEDIYLPVFEVPEDLHTIHLIDNTDWEPKFHHYHWNGSYFEYYGIETIINCESSKKITAL